MIEKTIIALDFPDKTAVENFLNKFDWSSQARPHFVKVGMELFYAAGPGIISYLKEKNLKIFLDLKLHDIPNTVASAITALNKFEIDILNVHASGTIKMMQAAKEACTPKTKLIAVTQLTSTDENTLNNELKITGSMQEAVLNLARNTMMAGLDGIVCSAQESLAVKSLSENFQAPGFKDKISDFITICPGIRFADGDKQDQKRVCTPEQAFNNKADYIVMGRAITKAEDPIAAIERLNLESQMSVE